MVRGTYTMKKELPTLVDKTVRKVALSYFLEETPLHSQYSKPSIPFISYFTTIEGLCMLLSF